MFSCQMARRPIEFEINFGFKIMARKNKRLLGKPAGDRPDNKKGVA